MRRVLAVLLVAGCHTVAPPLVPAAFDSADSASPPLPAACLVEPAPPTDGPWIPAARGLTVESVTGDPRLTASGYVAIAWSPDSSLVAFADAHAFSIWSAHDGALVSIAPYVGPSFETPRGVAWSPDGKRVTVRALRTVQSKEVPVALELDRTTNTVAEVSPTLETHALVGRGGVTITQRGDGRTTHVDVTNTRGLDIASGLVVVATLDDGARLAVGHDGRVDFYALPTLAPAGHVDLPGAENFAFSADGKHVAGWTLSRAYFDTPTPAQRAAEPKPFLAMWELPSGTQLWRDDKHCCEGWEFSPDGEYLIGPETRVRDDLIHITTGERVELDAWLRALSPDGKHVVVARAGGFEIRAASGEPEVAPHRTNDILVRHGDVSIQRLGVDGALNFGNGPAVLVADGTCTPLTAHSRDRDMFAFANDRIYGAQSEAGATLSVWNATGVLLGQRRAKSDHGTVPLPQLGGIGVFVANGLRVIDPVTGSDLRVTAAPHMSLTSGRWTGGLVWDERDLDGDLPSTLGGTYTATRDGRWIAGWTTFKDEVVSIWDTLEPRNVVDLELPGLATATAISPDGALVVAGTITGKLVAWSLPGRTPIAMTGSDAHGRILAIAFSHDGQHLAVSSADGTVRVLDTHGAEVGEVALVADTARLVTWSDDDHTLVIDTERHLTVTAKL